MLKKLDNKLDEIKKLYNDLPIQTPTSTGQDYLKLESLIPNGFKFGAPVYWKMSKQQRDDDISNTHIWHTDGCSFGKYMIICTYPYPTQFFLPNEDYVEEFEYHGHGQDVEIDENRGQIITPEIGDIMFTEVSTIHRTNPLSDGDHLVCRIYVSEIPKNG